MSFSPDGEVATFLRDYVFEYLPAQSGGPGSTCSSIDTDAVSSSHMGFQEAFGRLVFLVKGKLATLPSNWGVVQVYHITSPM